MSSKPGVLEPLRVRVRRFQFIVGLGFLSLVLGAMLSVSLAMRLHEQVGALPSDLLRLGVAVVLENLWVLAVLPVLCYGASRVVALRPWNTALGAAATGGLFVLALNFVRDGSEGLTTWNLGSVLRLVAFAGGILLSARAIRSGRAAAERGSTAAQVKAEARKSEYDEFLKAAEADGARMEQREGASAPVALDTAPAVAASDAAPAAAPDAAPEGTVSPPGEVPKTPAA
ncbi:hypothetical protein [Corallococcus llansteffanensis]|uniref:hypothetical protein n=1 Tax=Corallococcus llansteffanensis TaxID=2316731 RepID=UPI001ABEF032|nr:hypothetical protein [Corallococcus llansteffanensis]